MNGTVLHVDISTKLRSLFIPLLYSGLISACGEYVDNGGLIEQVPIERKSASVYTPTLTCNVPLAFDWTRNGTKTNYYSMMEQQPMQGPCMLFASAAALRGKLSYKYNALQNWPSIKYMHSTCSGVPVTGDAGHFSEILQRLSDSNIGTFESSCIPYAAGSFAAGYSGATGQARPNGQCVELQCWDSHYPSTCGTCSRPNCLNNDYAPNDPSCSLTLASTRYRVTDYRIYTGAELQGYSLDQIKCLIKQAPLVVYASNSLPCPQCLHGTNSTWHAYVIAGWTSANQWIFLDSWGPNTTCTSTDGRATRYLQTIDLIAWLDNQATTQLEGAQVFDAVKEAYNGTQWATVPATAQCGNSVVESGEACDDGNAVGGDGCSAFCQWETKHCFDVVNNRQVSPEIHCQESGPCQVAGACPSYYCQCR